MDWEIGLPKLQNCSPQHHDSTTTTLHTIHKQYDPPGWCCVQVRPPPVAISAGVNYSMAEQKSSREVGKPGTATEQVSCGHDWYVMPPISNLFFGTLFPMKARNEKNARRLHTWNRATYNDNADNAVDQMCSRYEQHCVVCVVPTGHTHKSLVLFYTWAMYTFRTLTLI